MSPKSRSKAKLGTKPSTGPVIYFSEKPVSLNEWLAGKKSPNPTATDSSEQVFGAVTVSSSPLPNPLEKRTKSGSQEHDHTKAERQKDKKSRTGVRR